MAAPVAKHDGIVHAAQRIEANVFAQGHVAEIADPRVARRLLVGPRDILGLGMVRRDAAADQPVGGRQPLDNVDLDIVRRAQQGFGRVKSARPGADDRDAERHTVYRYRFPSGAGWRTAGKLVRVRRC